MAPETVQRRTGELGGVIQPLLGDPAICPRVRDIRGEQMLTEAARGLGRLVESAGRPRRSGRARSRPCRCRAATAPRRGRPPRRGGSAAPAAGDPAPAGQSPVASLISAAFCSSAASSVWSWPGSGMRCKVGKRLADQARRQPRRCRRSIRSPPAGCPTGTFWWRPRRRAPSPARRPRARGRRRNAPDTARSPPAGTRSPPARARSPGRARRSRDPPHGRSRRAERELGPQQRGVRRPARQRVQQRLSLRPPAQPDVRAGDPVGEPAAVAASPAGRPASKVIIARHRS